MFQRLCAVAVLAASILMALPTWAGDKPEIGPPPAWVEAASIPAAPAADADTPAFVVLLDDRQRRFGAEADEFYRRRVVKVLKPEALTALGTVQVVWKPDTEDLTLNSLKIFRQGETVDVLSGAPFLVLRRETNLERAMLDGRLTATKQLEGLRIGDIIEFSSSVRRRDPVYQGRSEIYDALQHVGVAGRVRMKETWATTKPIRWRKTEGLPEPVISKGASETVLLVDATDLKPPLPPRGAPPRFTRLGGLELTQFADWAEVSALMAPLYAKASVLKPGSPLLAEAARIKAASKDPKARAAAALQLVQEQTRYLLLAMNDGGYVPSTADETWARRFGDCKGKTVMLLALLRELGIEAEPALVHLTEGDGLDEALPRLGAFNHVLVRARIGGRVYWLDGTRTGDLRGLDAIPALPFRWALPVRAKGAVLERLDVPPVSRPQAGLMVRVDASAGLEAEAPVTIEVTARGDLAEQMRRALTSRTVEETERSLRETYSKTYSWMEIEKITWARSADGVMTITITGRGRLTWRRNPDVGRREYRMPVSVARPNPLERRQPGPHRDAPYAVAHPIHSEASLELVLPDGGKGFAATGPQTDVDIAGVHLQNRVTLESGVARFYSSVRSFAREFPASEVEAVNALSRELSEEQVLVRAPADAPLAP